MLWIAGEGDPSAYQPAAREEVSKMDNIFAGVAFLGMQSDIAELLDAADGFVLSSAWEGMPLALGEAMAMAKPVVATDVGGVRELIADEGLIVAAANSYALAERMLQVMGMSRIDRAILGGRARERIQRHFSMSAKALEWEQSYSRCLAGRSS
jgi:glycosyltransferase involved in cell wall biosynthesis